MSLIEGASLQHAVESVIGRKAAEDKHKKQYPNNDPHVRLLCACTHRLSPFCMSRILLGGLRVRSCPQQIAHARSVRELARQEAAVAMMRAQGPQIASTPNFRRPGMVLPDFLHRPPPGLGSSASAATIVAPDSRFRAIPPGACRGCGAVSQSLHRCLDVCAESLRIVGAVCSPCRHCFGSLYAVASARVHTR